MRRKLFPFVLFNTDDPAAATPPAPEPVAAQPAAPAPPQPVVGDGPWAQDIQQTFQDPEVQRQVDAFLRAKVQPHVTQVEQQYAPAKQLWQDLQGDDSLDTYIAIAEQLYGAEAAQAVAQQFAQAQQQQAQQPSEPQQAQQPQLTPEQQAAIDWAETQRAEQLYNSELARVLATDAGATLKSLPEELRSQAIAPFVQSAEGDFDAAVNAYNHWLSQVQPAVAQPPAPEPPATLTSDGAPAAPPPTTPSNPTLDSAIDDFLNESRATAPATVGQV